jgi:hypothetical protein
MTNQQIIVDNFGSDTNKKQTKIAIFLHCFLLFSWFVSPVISAIPIFLYLYFMKNSRLSLYFYFFLLATIPALINYTKMPSSDLLQYYFMYMNLWTTDFSDFFDNVHSDWFFYIISMGLSRVADGNQQIFVLFWTIATYFIYFITLEVFAKNLESYNKKVVVGIVFYSLLIGLSFSLSGHLVRQFFAVTLLMLAIVLYAKKNKKSYILFLISFLSHISTVIFTFALLIGKIRPQRIGLMIGLLLFGTFILGFYNLLDIVVPLLANQSDVSLIQEVSQKAEIYIDKNDGEIGIRQVAEIILLSFFAGYLYFKNSSSYIKIFLLFYFVLIAILMATRNNNLLLLRYSFYFDFFANFLLIIFFTKYWNIFIVRLFFYALIFTAPIRLFGIINEGFWKYIDNSYLIILETVVDFLHFHPNGLL